MRSPATHLPTSNTGAPGIFDAAQELCDPQLGPGGVDLRPASPESTSIGMAPGVLTPATEHAISIATTRGILGPDHSRNETHVATVRADFAAPITRSPSRVSTARRSSPAQFVADLQKDGGRGSSAGQRDHDLQITIARSSSPGHQTNDSQSLGAGGSQ